MHITLKDASGVPMSGLVIIYEDPKGSAGTLTTGPDGSVSMRVDLEGDYMFSIEGTESKFRISVSKGASALQGKGSDDSSFDIASALFGGDSASFSFVAVLVLVLILIVGVGFYFLTQNEGDSI